MRHEWTPIQSGISTPPGFERGKAEYADYTPTVYMLPIRQLCRPRGRRGIKIIRGTKS